LRIDFYKWECNLRLLLGAVMFRKFVVSAAALVAMTGTAWAADLPNVKGAPAFAPPPPPAFSWTGFYVGANAGYGWNTGGGHEYCIDNTGVLDGPSCQILPPGVSGTSVGHGALVGGQLGYNWQSGNLVYGLETDFDAAFIRSYTAVDGPFAFAGGPGLGLALPPGVSTSSLDLESLGTFRGRLGYAIADRLLIYATGGLAYGGVNANSLWTSPSTGTIYLGATSKFRVGWTAGGGLEYALTNNWSAKIEGLYYDLGNVTTIGSEVPVVFLPSGYQHDVSFDVSGAIVRVGLNYKFDWFASPAPVVAKY
jgi:outer membrane immunogenic protein